MIKYIGSKRRLVPVLGQVFAALRPRTALDLFTGTTRVAQELKRQGAEVWAVDSARYAEVLARCYVATDGGSVDRAALAAAIDDLGRRPGRPGYVTETFCHRARYFQPKNGARIDAIRDAIEAEHRGTPLYPLLLTSLLLAADRVDSTTGLQMAYLKQWAPRSHNDLELRVPDLLAGPGHARRGDATVVVDEVPPVDVAYLDPPYNQHRYFTNYHVWETLVAWDAPPHYGVACKRLDSRDPSTRSVFNDRRRMPDALRALIGRVRAEVVVVSYNDESWIGVDELVGMCRESRDAAEVLSFDSRRYVGAQIGIHNLAGVKVGAVSHLRNRELLVVAGARAAVAEAVAAARAAAPEAAAS
ncbi:MAG: DNA adenine methylase [Acidimicrobiia bacterium]